MLYYLNKIYSRQKLIYCKKKNFKGLEDEEDEPMIEDSIKEKLESSQEQDEPIVKKPRSEETKDLLSSADDKSRQTSIAQTSFEDISDTKTNECDAKVEVLEDFEAYEEMNTAVTGTFRSESMASIDGKNNIKLISQSINCYQTY